MTAADLEADSDRMPNGGTFNSSKPSSNGKIQSTIESDSTSREDAAIARSDTLENQSIESGIELSDEPSDLTSVDYLISRRQQSRLRIHAALSLSDQWASEDAMGQ